MNKTITDETVIAWVDVETTGLSATDRLMEIGVILTRGPRAEVVDTISLLTIAATDTREQVVGAMGEYVQKMHTESGLIKEYLDPDSTVLFHSQAQDVLVDFIAKHCPEPPPMGGSSITFDRGVLDRLMPDFHRALHYQSVDMTSIRFFASTVLDDVPQALPSLAHRSINDLKGDIEAFRRIRQALRS